MKKITVFKIICYSFHSSENFGKLKKKTVIFFKNTGILKFLNIPMESKSSRPFIWDRSQIWNRDIDNFFPKKRKYWCLDFTNCTVAALHLQHFEVAKPKFQIFCIIFFTLEEDARASFSRLSWLAIIFAWKVELTSNKGT